MDTNPPLIPRAAPTRPRPRPSNYPNPETPLGRAWATAWAELTRAGGDLVDGSVLAELAAEIHGLKPVTVSGLLTRAATAGLLERQHKTVDGTRGPRTRTFYRRPQA